MIWVNNTQYEKLLILLPLPKSFLGDVVQLKSVSSKRWSGITLDPLHLLFSCSKITHIYILHLYILVCDFIYTHIPASNECSKNIHEWSS